MTTADSCFALRLSSRLVGMAALFLLLFVLPALAVAGLGGDVGSVQNDQLHLQAARKITQVREYAVHEITAPNGTVVREYVSSGGRVFGIAWDGPFMPNIRQLLG